MSTISNQLLSLSDIDEGLPQDKTIAGQLLSFTDVDKEPESLDEPSVLDRSSLLYLDDIAESDITPSDFKSAGLDVNSSSHKWDLAIDNTGVQFYSTLAMMADMIGADETAKDFRKTSKDYQRIVDSKPKPDISMNITDESAKIYDRFSEGEILGAITDTAEWVHSALIGIGPSLIATGGAVTAGVLAAPVLASAGIPAVLTVAVLGSIPGLVLSAGSIHDEAIKHGASPEEAQALGLGAGAVIGLLDRIGFGFLISGLTKKLGKDLTIKTIKDQTKLSTKTIKEAVETAEKIAKKGITKEALKGAGKGFLAEGVTEGTQSLVQNVSPSLISNKEIKSAELLKGFIDDFAVGGTAGGTIRGTLSGASVGISRQANRQIEENEAIIDKITEAIPENNKFVEDDKNFIGPPTLEDFQIEEERARIEGRERIVDTPRVALTEERETRGVYDFDQDVEALSLERDKLIIKQKSGKNFSRADAARLKEITRSLRNRRGGTSNSVITNLMKRATSPLQKLANTSPVARRMVQDLTNFFVETNQEIGSFYKTKELINDRIRKSFKIPFQSSIPKKIKTEVANQLNYKDYNSTNPDVVAVAQQIREEILDPLYIRLKASGVDIGRVDEYLTRIFKIRPKGLGRKKDVRKFTEILTRNGFDGQQIMDNILENDGVYIPDPDIDILVPNTRQPSAETTQIDPEKPRNFPDEVVKELQEAGLLETDFNKILNKYIVSSVRRAKLKNFADTYNPVINKMHSDGVMELGEAELIKNLVDALQHRYRPIKSRSHKTILQFLNTGTYMATLTGAAVTALSEPFIVLSRVSPKNSLLGLMAASEATLRQGIRTFLPKFKRSQNEEALMSTMQTADLALADAIRDIGDISVSKKITDTFFRAIGLAQVTQFSRNVALQASSRQIAEDLQTLHNQEIEGGRITQKSRRARKRLELGGLSNIIPRINKKTGEFDPLTETQREVLEWADQYRGAKKAGISTEPFIAPPDIITQSSGKTVDEVIMTPNPLNKPLWMSNPHWSFAALLKGFMMTFGNTVGMRMYKEVFQPWANAIAKRDIREIGKTDPADIAKWAITWTLLTSAILGVLTLKNAIRYGPDEDSPYDDLSIKEKIREALLQSNIFGYGNVAVGFLRAEKYGGSGWGAILGPLADKFERLASALGSGSPSRVATALGGLTPLSTLPKVRRPDIGAEDVIEDVMRSIGLK